MSWASHQVCEALIPVAIGLVIDGDTCRSSHGRQRHFGWFRWVYARRHLALDGVSKELA
jgi:hypothetical protein